MATRTPQTLARIERLIEQARDIPLADIGRWRERARLAVVAVYGEDSDQLKRLDKVRYALGFATESTPRSAYDEARRRGVRNTTAILEAILEDIHEHLVGPEAPHVDFGGLHPWVADQAARLWANGHRQQAVQAAAASVERWLRVKLDAHQGPAASVVTAAFSPKDPEPDQPRLRFDTYPEGSDSWRSEHEGAGAFGRGVMMRIRNLYTHASGADEHEDLEALAALSLLARWIDTATVARVHGPPL